MCEEHLKLARYVEEKSRLICEALGVQDYGIMAEVSAIYRNKGPEVGRSRDDVDSDDRKFLVSIGIKP